jgi:glycosyltransferase involved in cell wall biosynthesis
MRELGVDLVHTNHPLDRLYAGLAARLVGIPSITTAHNTLYGPRPAAKRLRSWVESRLFSQYIAVSAAVAARYEAAVRIPLSRINVIYSGIEVQKFGLPLSTDVIQQLTGQLGLNGADPILVSVGRLHPIKGHKHLIPMMSQLLPRWPHARLLIVGEGSERADLESAIAQAGLERSIALLGMRTDIRELLAISTAFVFPSISEGLPIAVLEAMAAGKPVIASRVGPMPEMVEDGVSGLLVPPEDPSALADAVGRLLTLPGQASQMGRQAQKIAATRFSVDAAARSMEALYRTVLSSHHA